MNYSLTFEEYFIKINYNLLETNIINIFFIFLILLYSYKTSFRFSLLNRQKDIINTIENSQKDLSKTLELYLATENIFRQTLFCFSFWKKTYQNKKLSIINFKCTNIIQNTIYSFTILDSFLRTFDKKKTILLQNYVLLIIGSKILRIFFSFSDEEQLKISQFTLNKFKKIKNDK